MLDYEEYIKLERRIESLVLEGEFTRETVATYKDSLREIQVDYVRYKPIWNFSGNLKDGFIGYLEILFKVKGKGKGKDKGKNKGKNKVDVKRLPHFYSNVDILTFAGDIIIFPKAKDYKPFVRPQKAQFILLGENEILYGSLVHKYITPLLWKDDKIYKIDDELLENLTHGVIPR